MAKKKTKAGKQYVVTLRGELGEVVFGSLDEAMKDAEACFTEEGAEEGEVIVYEISRKAIARQPKSPIELDWQK
jgi:hypothetical protein